MAIDVDSILRLLGSPGCYQIFIYILLCCNYFPVILNHLAMAFYGAKTSYHCKVPAGFLLNDSVPFTSKGDVSKPNQCLVYQNFDSGANVTESCPDGWDYQVDDREWNIIMEWELTCDKAYLVSLSTTIYFSGVMLGGLFFGSLSDRFGRKPFMLITLYVHIAVGTGLAFVQTYWQFVLLRFVQGVLMQGLQTCTFVMITEMFSREYRTAAGTIFEVFWGGGVMWLAGVGYVLRNWRHIQLAITLTSVVTFFYVCVVPESLRWLIVTRKYERAHTVLERAAKCNRVTLPTDPLSERDEHWQEENIGQTTAKKYNVFDMFKTPSLRKRSFILFYLWFVSAVGYYGLSLSITSLAGNKYLNLFIGGAVEMPAYCGAVFILKRFGRRKPFCAYLFIGGIFCITAGALPSKVTSSGVDLSLVSTALALIGRFGMAGCFSVILLFSSELYPTCIRNVSLGACAFWTRVGGMVAPQILLLAQYTEDWVPVVIIGVLALLGGCLALLLPETHNKKLPETIEQAEYLAHSEAIKQEGMDNPTFQSTELK